MDKWVVIGDTFSGSAGNPKNHEKSKSILASELHCVSRKWRVSKSTFALRVVWLRNFQELFRDQLRATFVPGSDLEPRRLAVVPDGNHHFLTPQNDMPLYIGWIPGCV